MVTWSSCNLAQLDIGDTVRCEEARTHVPPHIACGLSYLTFL